jgi:hypothetical protein
MSGCSQTNTPVLDPLETDFCKGVHTSTACIFPKEAITYLGIKTNETLQQALVKISNAIKASNDRIALLEDQVEQLQADLLACCS